MAKYFSTLALAIILFGCAKSNEPIIAVAPLQAGIEQLQQAKLMATELVGLSEALANQPNLADEISVQLAILRTQLSNIDPLLVLPGDPQQRWQRLYYPDANSQYLLPSPQYPFAGLIADKTIALVPEKLIEAHQQVMLSDQALGIEPMLIVASSLVPQDPLFERKQAYLYVATNQLELDLDYAIERWNERVALSITTDFVTQWKQAYLASVEERQLSQTKLDNFLSLP